MAWPHTVNVLVFFVVGACGTEQSMLDASTDGGQEKDSAPCIEAGIAFDCSGMYCYEPSYCFTGGGGQLVTTSCKSLPATCSGCPSCDCITATLDAGCICGANDAGHVSVVCP